MNCRNVTYTRLPPPPEVSSDVICYIAIPGRRPLFVCVLYQYDLDVRDLHSYFQELECVCVSVGLCAYLQEASALVFVCSCVCLYAAHMCRHVPRYMQAAACLTACAGK